MPFEFMKTDIEGVTRLRAKVFGDERGYFFEIYKKSEFDKNGIIANLKQDNESYSTRGVLRGLHYQRAPFAQGKLVRVTKGKIFDVAVDLRTGSKTLGKYVSAILSSENREMLWIPEGFAHGFLALEDSIVSYKTTNEYDKKSEAGIVWNDRNIDIKWPFTPESISEKDRAWPTSSNVLKETEIM